MVSRRLGFALLAALLAVATSPASRAADDLDSAALFIESELQPLSPYVQQLMTYKVRLYSAVRLSRGELSAPTHDDAIIEVLGPDKRYKLRIGNRDYRVLERVYGVLAQSSGPFRIPAATFVGTAKPRRNSGTLLDSYRQPVSRSVRVQGRGHGVLVRARPGGTTGPWIPAHRVLLQDSWEESPPALVAGEPVERVLTLSAQGLTAAQLPALVPLVPAGVRIYPAPPTLETTVEAERLLSRRTQRFSIVASRPGTFEFMPVTVSWWDVTTNTPREVVASAQRLTVTQGGTPQTASGIVDRTPLWVGIGLAIVALASVHVASRRRRRAPSPPSRRASLRALARAERARNPLAARQALLAWGRRRWPQAPPSTLVRMARLIDDEAVEAALRNLDATLYAPEGHDVPRWHAAGLSRRLSSLTPARRGAANAALPPLYGQ